MLAALEAYAAAPLQTGDDYAADAVVCAVRAARRRQPGHPTAEATGTPRRPAGSIALGHYSADASDIPLLCASPGGSPGLLTLVDRSNRPVGDWMAKPDALPRWETWWAVHGGSIRTVDPPRPIPRPLFAGRRRPLRHRPTLPVSDRKTFTRRYVGSSRLPAADRRARAKTRVPPRLSTRLRVACPLPDASTNDSVHARRIARTTPSAPHLPSCPAGTAGVRAPRTRHRTTGCLDRCR